MVGPILSGVVAPVLSLLLLALFCDRIKRR